MEHRYYLSDLVQTALIIGAPVFAVTAVALAYFLRHVGKLSWAGIGIALMVWLPMSVGLQLLVWSQLDLSEEAFMVFGFINTPALIGNLVSLAVLLGIAAAWKRHRVRNASR